MNARKIRFDESFVADRDEKPLVTPGEVKALGSSDPIYVPSPARQLQQQLKDQIDDSIASKPAEKFSGLVSISVIVGSSLVLWAGAIGLAVMAYG
ncbi:hypothetical protein [Sphingorhabdus sp. Alg231-15]|uniref:hypothetical protein n=1 Tax=Sphingorhabdus sp. Alg231-15 TaxID=1922222 RepID=UPI000D54F066